MLPSSSPLVPACFEVDSGLIQRTLPCRICALHKREFPLWHRQFPRARWAARAPTRLSFACIFVDIYKRRLVYGAMQQGRTEHFA
jgi:hypothetical protein